MNPRKAGLRWLYFVAVNLAVVVALFAAYFFFFFDAKYDYYIQRDFRALDEMSAQLSARFLHVRHVLDFWPDMDRKLPWGRLDQALIEARVEEAKLARAAQEKDEPRDLYDECGLSRSPSSSVPPASEATPVRNGDDTDSLPRLSQKAAAAAVAVRAAKDRYEARMAQLASERSSTTAAGSARIIEEVHLDASVTDLFSDLAQAWQAEAQAGKALYQAQQRSEDCKKFTAVARLPAETAKVRDHLALTRKTAAYRDLTVLPVTNGDSSGKGADADPKGEKTGGTDDTTDAAPARERPEIPLQAGAAPRIRIDTTGSAVKVVFRYAPEGSQPIEARLSLAHLIDEDRVRENFDQFLIARGDGRVIYELPDAGLHFGRLGALLAGVAAESSAPAASDEPFELLRQALQTARRNPRAVDPSSRSTLLKTSVGEREVLVFVQPYRPVFGEQAENADDEVWYIAGIVSQDRFTAKVMAVPLTVFAVVMFGLAMGILAWPFLKILFISPNEKLHPLDAHLLMASLVLGVGLVSLAFIDIVAHLGLRRQFDLVAREIATRMQRDLDSELTEAALEVDQAELRMCAMAGAQAGRLSCDGRRSALAGPTAVVHPWPTDDPSTAYPSYELAFLLDDAGRQVGPQVTYRGQGVECVHVPHRRYFLKARDGPLPFRPACAHDRAVGSFFAERVETYDHGSKLTFFSKPTKARVVSRFSRAVEAPESDGCGRSVAVVVGKQVKTLWRPVLPPGFGFAVIADAGGRVQFHSDDHARSLVESFFVETDNDRSLQAAVAMRRHDHISGSYRGVGHRFYVSPVRGTPWSLIVFYELPTLQALNFELLLIVGFHLLLYALALGLGIIVASLAADKTRWSWVWPRGELSRRYEAATTFLAALASYELASLFVVDGLWLAFVLISLPLIVLGSLYVGFRPRQAAATGGPIARRAVVLGVAVSLTALWGAPDWTAVIPLPFGLLAAAAGRRFLRVAEVDHHSLDDRGRLAYVGTGFAALVIVAVFPAIVLFKDAYEIHAEKLIRYGQLQVARALDERAATIHADAVRLIPRQISLIADGVSVGLRPADRCRGYYVDDDIFSPRDNGDSPSACLPASGTAAGGDCWRGECPTGCCPTPEIDSANLEGERHEAMTKRLTGWLATVFPTYSDESAELRNVLYNAADHGNVYWPTSAEVNATECKDEKGGPVLWYRGGRDRTYRIASQPIPFPWPQTFFEWALVALGALLLLAALWIVVATLAVRVLGINLTDFGRMWSAPALGDWVKDSRVVVRPDPKFVDKLVADLKLKYGDAAIDVVQLPLSSDLVGRGAGALSKDLRRPELCVITGFESRILEDTLRLAFLEALERRVLVERRPVAIFAEISPLYRWIKPSAYPDTDEQDPSADEQLRWGRLLAAFLKERYPVPEPTAPPTAGGNESSDSVLDRECGWAWPLIPIRDALERSPAYVGGQLTHAQVVERITDQASAFYRKLWALCTRNERLALISLANGYLVNPRNVDVVERLIRRGLIRRDPAFRIVSESFGAFVRTAESPERLAQWEREAPESTWHLIRTPLVVVLVLVALFVAYVGQEAVDATVGLVPALLAAVPMMARALSSFRGAGSGSAPPS